MKITKKQLFDRQITLSEIGESGQEKLAMTSVLIVGCGGLGSAAAVYLAASGIGTIQLLDFDEVDASNLHRQVFYKLDQIGSPKVEALASHIRAITPFVKVTTIHKALIKENVFDCIKNADYVLDCTDSLPTKYLLNDACVLKNKSLVYGSLYKFDGYIASFNIKQSDGSYSANLRDAFSEIPKENIPNCSEIGTLNSIVGIIAIMQANEVLKLSTQIGNPLINSILIYNSLENSQYRMQLKNTIDKTAIQSLFNKESYADNNCLFQDQNLLISAQALREKLAANETSKNLQIISVIQDTSVTHPFRVHQKIPLTHLNLDTQKFNTENEYIIVCQKGISSYIATQRIKEKHPNLKVLSLKDGIRNF